MDLGDVVQRLLDECESRAVTGEPYGRSSSETVSSESVTTVIEAPLTIAPASTRQQQRRRPTSPSRKPDFSYVEMITQALVDVNKPKMTLAEIYLAIVTNHPYYLDAGTGWQNSIRHCLSLNNAFTKIDRTLEEPGKGCFWALRKEGDAPKMPCRKRKGRDTASSAADLTAAARNVTARVKAVSLSSLDGMVDLSVSSNSPGSFPDSAPSPAASEDAEDSKAPRRSGRARRPPRPKEAEEYIGHARHSSATGASLSTPPSSPAPYGQENETHQSALPLRKRASSVKSEFGVFASDQEESPSALSSRKGTQDNIDLTSVPGVVTTQRIRRPPQNLAEFVSSEDFKASPCGKRQERTLQSSTSSTSLNGTSGDGTGRDKWEASRGRSESQLSFSASTKRSALLSDMDQDQDQNQDQDPTTDSTQAFEEGHERSASMPDLATAANVRGRDKEAQPATIPLSALSHSKRSSQDFSCMGTKKQRRDGKDGKAPRPGYTKRHSTNSFPSRKEILERRRRDGKREIMVASEDDYSDSDFDFLRDEQENYRLMRIRARKMQRARGWWRSSYDDDDDDEDDDEEVRRKEDAKRCGDVAGYGGCIKEEYSQSEGETLKLLMDPSVINYGFDSGDGEYILDFHQGPLFNNVTWPEFSDVKEEGASKGIHPHHTTNTLATSTNTSTATATTTTTGAGATTDTD
ncbi:Forkhead box protein J2, partial [Dissophora globulifera]